MSSSDPPQRPWADSKAPDWAAPLPLPRSNPPELPASEVAELIRTKRAGVDFLVVDVRRMDWENAYIRTSINLPAQSFHQSLPALVPILKKVPLVIFTCNSCTITGRGPRIAAWYQDALDAQGIESSSARVLTGGIKGWVATYGDVGDLTVKI
ncbi:hypothetical protein NM688_g1658 [Phlebia brevispora]|uniref:Uncharacterized protein n=1 Tax=Phlebia brevispora TaxID=194682 RepID=A0ACC1TB53_9APHY|nr:hypothetical protein NM688_g1658 [Phlebia brevispora]